MFDETNLAELFTPKMMPKTKDLLAGYGWRINAKNINPYLGFVGSHVILTANELEYPWVPPRSSAAGIN